MKNALKWIVLFGFLLLPTAFSAGQAAALSDDIDGGGFFPANFELEFCWQEVGSCSTTILTAQADGTFTTNTNSGDWLYNPTPKTSAILFDAGCKPVYFGRVVSGLNSEGEMICQLDGFSVTRGTWSTTYLPGAIVPTPDTHPMSIDAAGGNGVTALPGADIEMTQPDFNFILEFCWGADMVGCGATTGLTLSFPAGTFMTDDGGQGLWVKNFTADTFAMLFDGGCLPAYIGIGIGGFDSAGTQHCLDGSGQTGAWQSTYLPLGGPITTTPGTSTSSPK